MSLQRYYWVGSSLDDFEQIERELEKGGTLRGQIHLLTLDDAGAARHHQLNAVQSLMKKDLVRSGFLGFGIGVLAAALVLFVAGTSGWVTSPAGWIPFVFLAVVILGFATWEGGLWGIQTQNVSFRRFEDLLRQGKHVFFVDLEPTQAERLTHLMELHPSTEYLGKGTTTPRWVIMWQHRLNHFFTKTMP